MPRGSEENQKFIRVTGAAVGGQQLLPELIDLGDGRGCIIADTAGRVYLVTGLQGPYTVAPPDYLFHDTESAYAPYAHGVRMIHRS